MSALSLRTSAAVLAALKALGQQMTIEKNGQAQHFYAVLLPRPASDTQQTAVMTLPKNRFLLYAQAAKLEVGDIFTSSLDTYRVECITIYPVNGDIVLQEGEVLALQSGLGDMHSGTVQQGGATYE